MAAGAYGADQKTAKKKSAAAPQAVTIPKDAIADPGGATYRWKDKAGKKWVYARTPFGIMRYPDSGQSGDTPASAVPTKVIDKGDSVRFERPTPFGTTTWEKKKTELTDDERQIFEAQNPKTEQTSVEQD